jgi:predicted DNA-binding transcriptional regulator YafY
MSITFETLEMARRHVLNMGDMVRVLEPQELRDSLLDLATRVVALYA